MLVALTLDPAEAVPTLDQLAAALDHPARPLFIGRKTCLPSTPVRLDGPLPATDATAALRHGAEKWVNGVPDSDAPVTVEMDHRLAAMLTERPKQQEMAWLTDLRDWRNQMHTGTRAVVRFDLLLAAGSAAS